MKCDYCGQEFKTYDLTPILAYRRTKYVCYKCRQKGEEEVRKATLQGMQKKGIIGDR